MGLQRVFYLIWDLCDGIQRVPKKGNHRLGPGRWRKSIHLWLGRGLLYARIGDEKPEAPHGPQGVPLKNNHLDPFYTRVIFIGVIPAH